MAYVIHKWIYLVTICTTVAGSPEDGNTEGVSAKNTFRDSIPTSQSSQTLKPVNQFSIQYKQKEKKTSIFKRETLP